MLASHRYVQAPFVSYLSFQGGCSATVEYVLITVKGYQNYNTFYFFRLASLL